MSANYLFFFLFNDFAMFFFFHVSHVSSRNIFNEINGDLFVRTNHTNAIKSAAVNIEFVKIRATV